MSAVNYSQKHYVFFKDCFISPTKQVDEQYICSCFVVIKLVKTFVYLSHYWNPAFVCVPVLGKEF